MPALQLATGDEPTVSTNPVGTDQPLTVFEIPDGADMDEALRQIAEQFGLEPDAFVINKVGPDAETVEQTSYDFLAIYTDGTSLAEHDATGPHRFGDIDQDRLSEFALIPNRPDLQQHRIHIAPPWRLVFYRRARTASDGTSARLHVIGRQATIAGENVKHLMAVTDFGATYTTSDDDLLEP